MYTKINSLGITIISEDFRAFNNLMSPVTKDHTVQGMCNLLLPPSIQVLIPYVLQTNAFLKSVTGTLEQSVKNVQSLQKGH